MKESLISSRVRVLILSFTDHRNDPRVFRQIQALADSCAVTTAGVCPDIGLSVCHIPLTKKAKGLLGNVMTALLLKTRQFDRRYWRQSVVQDALQKLSKRRFDVIISNDLETLPVAVKVASDCGAKIYFDAHEYEPKVLDEQFFFNFFFSEYYDYLCREYLTRANYMTTVCQGISEEYQAVYGVHSDVIINAPEFKNLTVRSSVNSPIKIIHHGGINPSRKIENMIRLVGECLGSEFTLDLMLVDTDPNYMIFLKKEAKHYRNIRFVDPVPMPLIAETINGYDIGLYMLPPDSFNNKLALPNKFFEFIQARLAIAIWPSPEMKNIVEQEQIGVVSKDFTIESMATEIRALSVDQICQYKVNSARAAKKYNAENCSDQIKKMVKRLASESSSI